MIQIYQAAGGGGDVSSLTHEAVSADADKAMAVNTLYLVTMGAWASDNIFSLPTTAAVGDRVAVYIVDGDDTYELQVRTTSASNDTIDGIDYDSIDWGRLCRAGEYVEFECITANTEWKVTHDGRRLTGLTSSHIIGVGYNRNSTTAIQIETGEIMVNGQCLYVTSAFTTKTAASSSLSATALFHVYITNDAGTIKQEWDVWATTADDPVKNVDLDYWEHPSKGAAYRYVGSFWTDGSSLIIDFVAKTFGRNAAFVPASIRTIVNGATANGTASIAGIVPKTAIQWPCLMQVNPASSATQFMTVRNGTTSSGPVLISNTQYLVTGKNTGISKDIYRASDDIYHSVQVATDTRYVKAFGFTVER